MRRESAYKATGYMVVAGVIHAADDRLVRLNSSIGPTKVAEVLLRKLPVTRKLVHYGTLKIQLPTRRTYLTCPMQSMPAYRFAKDVSRTTRTREPGVYMTCLGYPS